MTDATTRLTRADCESVEPVASNVLSQYLVQFCVVHDTTIIRAEIQALQKVTCPGEVIQLE